MIGEEQYKFLLRLKKGDMTEGEVAAFLSRDVGYATVFAESLSDCCYRKYVSRNGEPDTYVYTISPNAFGEMEEYYRSRMNRRINTMISLGSFVVAVLAIIFR